jgi:hypothetical protein
VEQIHSVVFVPLGHTKVARHEQLGLPGFAILEDKVEPLAHSSDAEVERKEAI